MIFRLFARGPGLEGALALRLGRQVLRGYNSDAKREYGGLNEAEPEQLQRMSALMLKSMFQAELQGEEGSEYSRLKGSLGVGKTDRRRANKDWVLKLDNMLCGGLGIPFSAFRPKREVKPLEKGVRRYMAELAMPSGELQRRSCVELRDGTRSIEVPRDIVEGPPRCPTLHLCADQGSIGAPAMLWLQQSQSMRLTVSWDLCHRLHNDLRTPQLQAV